MVPSRLLAILLLLGTLSSLRAIETVVNGTPTFNTNNNISGSVSGWSSGWGTGNTNTGWNYVGQVSDASGVYLGNGWVITAAHVNNPTTFTLNGNTYNNTGVYHSSFTNPLSGTTNADLTLFQISTISTTGTNLPLSYNLTITSNAPTLSTSVVMIGYGYTNGYGPESWGKSTVYTNNVGPVNVNGFESIDFVSANIGYSYGTLVNGDSGGGDFVNVGGAWQLAGINEATNSFSYFVQLSDYATQINSFVNPVPEPSTWALVGFGMLALLGSHLKTLKIRLFGCF